MPVRPAMSVHAPDQRTVHLIIPTHTPRHLDACLACIAWQVRPPETAVVSCDVDDPEIPALLERWWPRIAALCRPVPKLIYTARPHQGHARLNQVRNNALRALDRAASIGPADTIVVLDGDTLLAGDAVLRHSELAGLGFELIIPYRVNLDRARSLLLTAERLLDTAATGADPTQTLITPAERESLMDRHRRYLRQLRLRQAPLPGLPKAHKPKIIGGHHAVSVRCLRAVNGYDEQYTGYGYDDDDLARRLHALEPPPRAAIAVNDILAFHLWHPSRAPERPTEAPGYVRFSTAGLPVVAERGWRNPLAQPEPVTRMISAMRPTTVV